MGYALLVCSGIIAIEVLWQVSIVSINEAGLKRVSVAKFCVVINF